MPEQGPSHLEEKDRKDISPLEKHHGRYQPNTTFLLNHGNSIDAQNQLSNRAEIERLEQSLTADFLQYFFENFELVKNDSSMPKQAEQIKNMLKIPDGWQSSGLPEFVHIRAKNNQQLELSALESIINTYWKNLLVQHHNSIDPNKLSFVESYTKKIMAREIKHAVYQVELEIAEELYARVLADEYKVSVEEARSYPMYWIHNFPAENVKDVIEQGGFLSRADLLKKEVAHTSISGVTQGSNMFSGKHTRDEHDITHYYVPKIFGCIERTAKTYTGRMYTGIVPEEILPEAWDDTFTNRNGRDAYDWAEKNGVTEKLSYKKFGSSGESESFERNLQQTGYYDDQGKYTTRLRASGAWDVIFMKPLQLITKEAVLASSPFSGNEAGGGVGFYGKISTNGGTFGVFSKAAMGYLIDQGVSQHSITLLPNDITFALDEQNQDEEYSFLKRESIGSDTSVNYLIHEPPDNDNQPLW